MPIACLSPKGAVQSSLASYLREIKETPLLSWEEERELASRSQEGDSTSRDHLVRANLRLVVNIARRFTQRGMDLQDLIMEGNLGLLRAVEDFDPARQTRFCTYASYWIKAFIRQGMRQTARTIRVPAYMLELMRKWHQVSSQLHAMLGRPPTEEEVAHRLNVSGKKLRILQTALQVYNAQPPGANEGQGSSPWEALPDRRSEGPGNQAAKRDLLDHILGLLDQLEAREAAVLRLRFGLNEKEPLTLKEIGTRLGLTRERVRQIEATALRKLAEKVATD
jgi:RNA polymerase primary sigma factor